jgi:hypothetical protein
MKAERMLRRKVAFSYVYLLLAFASAILPFIMPTFYSSNLIFIWMATIFYAFNFYRGAIYYPKFYRENLRRRWTFWSPFMDSSISRGLVSTVLVMMYFAYFVFVLYETSPLPAIVQDNFGFWVLAWIIFNILLNQASQTTTCFSFRTAYTDHLSRDSKGRLYENLHASICFYLPKGEPEEKFSAQAVKAYLKSLEEEADNK